MPGKSQASSRGKQDSSKERLSSAKSNNESVKRVCIWPAWSESDVEKQDQAVSGKGRDKAKAGHVPTLYEDPEGVVLPQSLLDMGEVCWKRPSDPSVSSALGSEDVAVVTDPDCASIDLISNNTHILHSEFVSWLVRELWALWSVRGSLPPHTTTVDEGSKAEWKPWTHVYPQAKGNPGGKYYIRLFWMGSWRKVTIDDSLPFLDKTSGTDQLVSDDNDRFIPLYPRTSNPSEIWPALLMKAVLKVAALDMVSGVSRGREFGDMSVVHLLTGWVPQVMTLDHSSKEGVWNDLIVPSLPLWVRDSEENGRQNKECVVMASFRNPQEQVTRRTSLDSVQDTTTVEDTLREAGLLSSTFDQTSFPTYPMLLTQARDEPLVLPPETPPPPVLQAPFYLGLKHRRPTPGEPAPPTPPPPEAPWFVEILPQEGGGPEASEKGSCAELESEGGPVWMCYSDFIDCFSHLYLFRNPSSFKHRNTCVDLSKTVEEQTPAPPPKKSASSAQLISSSKVLSPLKDNNILFVDSPQSIQLHFVLSSLSNWREGQTNTHTIPLKTLMPKHGSGEAEQVIAGRLVVENSVWSSVQTTTPLLRVKTTGTRGATLSLPPGRHVLKLHVKTPIAHHLGVFSNSEFVLTDDDNIYTHLSKESSLYTSYCSEFIQTLVSASAQCGEESPGSLEASLLTLVDRLATFGLTAQHANLLLASVLTVWSSHSKEYGLTNRMWFAWKAFFYKSFSILEQGLPPSSTVVDVQSVRRSLSKAGLKEHRPSTNGNSDASAQEQKAAVVITQTLQRHTESRRKKLMIPGTADNKQALQEIEKSLSILQPHLSTLGVEIFNGVFSLEPSLRQLFPFHTDESMRCFSVLYTGSFPPLQPNSWTVVVRAVFQISTPQTLVPHFTCPVPSYLLRVINNDTMTEVPRLFHATTPLTYTPNTHGYTVQVEAWCQGGEVEGTEGGKWGLRLVSSSQQLPALVGEEGDLVTPHTQELVDYSLPDRDSVLFRYALTPSRDLPVSLQLSTSKQDAYCKLQVLDDEVSVCEVEGRRVCIIPLHYLQASTEETKPHKYIVQAVVLRESWPVPETAWPHISAIRSLEKLEEKPDTKPGSAKKARSKGAASKKSNASSSSQMSPYSQNNVDATKPHWTLRISTNAADKDHLSVAKDTEKADALRAMVQAWETQQPGRSKKALESRRKFLEARAINDDGGDRMQIPNGPVKIQQMDLSPFIINEGPPHVLDEAEQEQRLQERQQLFKNYRAERQTILQQRNSDREARNEAKVRQLEQAEAWQSDLDQVRNKLISGREAIIREMYSKKERANSKVEAEVSQEVQPAPISGRESKIGKGKAAKGKKK